MMAQEASNYKIFPISDSALTIELGSMISEETNAKVLALFHDFQKEPITGVVDTIPAYCSLTVYYDVFQLSKSIPADKTVYEWMTSQVEERLLKPPVLADQNSRLVEIPVCYAKEFA